jgi:hypothetical protein
MGAWYDVVNPAKRQYLRIEAFGEDFKYGGLITGHNGRSLHAMAIAWLVSRFPGSEYSDLQILEEIQGCWFGDPIYLASDEAPADTAGISTSTPDHPDRNLYRLAHQEFEDVTARVIKSLCEKDQDIAEILVEGSCERDFRLFAEVAIELRCGPFQDALERRFGENWQIVCERGQGRPSDDVPEA